MKQKGVSVKLFVPLLALPLLLAGCETNDQPYSPVEDVRYTALGHDPFWLVTIGDDRIVLTLGPEGGRADGALDSYAFPRVLPREENSVTRWESADGTSVITVEARPGPCAGSSGRRYADVVHVMLSGRELKGCGGRQLTGRRS